VANFFQFAGRLVSSELHVKKSVIKRHRGKSGGLRIRAGSPQSIPSEERGRRIWNDPTGGLRISREENTFFLEFQDIGWFVFDQTDNALEFVLAKSSSPETFEHTILDQVLPRIVSHLGLTVIHAGAVMVGSKAALFLGDSGAGKSTLVASLFTAGHALLSDDAVVLGVSGGLPTARATYPSLRLWPSSLEKVADPTLPVAPMAHYSTKRRLLLDTADRIETGEVPIGGIFVIEATDQGTESPVTVTQLTESDVTIDLVKAGFRLDPTDPVVAARDMQRAATVAKATPGWRLTYPRNFSVLGHVRDAIIEKMALGNG
jgi:hypothetical protein